MVRLSEGERVADMLAELLAEEQHRRRHQPPAPSTTSLWLQPPFAFAISLAMILLAFFWVTGPSRSRSAWFEQGALITRAVEAGEWWRLITAATLHADAGHALGNAAFMVILGWAVGERVGRGTMAFAAVLTAVAGFGVSLGFAAADVTVGASGGLFGLLGVAAAHGAKVYNPNQTRRRQVWRALGAGLMLLAFTAFSQRANIHAHVGGFAAGLVLGAVLPRLPLPAWVQLGLGAVTAGAVVGAWRLAG